jgi:DNA-3-methyladenine glycosylase I
MRSLDADLMWVNAMTDRSTIQTVVPHPDGVPRCAWCGTDPLYIAYHDAEWGRPLHDDRRLFELLCLEGAQAGLSWITILRKREGYRRAFDAFDAAKIARYAPSRMQRLMQDPGIVRNRLKVEAFVANANAYLALREQGTTLDELVWRLRPATRAPRRRSLADIPASTAESDAMSRELKRRGFRFVGTTICYAFMQAAGIVDDHVRGCWIAAGNK